MISLPTLRAILTGKVFGLTPLAEVATQKLVLHPEETLEAKAAISLPDELERARTPIDTTTWAQQREWLRAGPSSHLATTSYLLEDALIDEQWVTRRSFVERVTSRSIPSHRQTSAIDEAAFVSSGVIDQYFGHWILDGLGLEALAKERGLMALTTCRPPWLHEAGYRSLSDSAAPLAVCRAKVQRLWITDDRGLNSGRIERLRSINRLVRNNVNPRSTTRVFIGRGIKGAARRLTNEDEILTSLKQRGFTIIHPENMSAEEVSSILAGSKIVVGVEGSAMSHSNIASPPGCTILNIQPPYRFNALAKKNADALDQRYAYTVAEERENGQFYQPVDRINRLLDIVDRIETN